MSCADEIFILLLSLATFTGSLLAMYGIVRAWYWLTGREWIDY